jgi:CBS domain-containing protein
MAQQIQDVMTRDVVMLEPNASLVEAARRMRDENIGDVLVGENHHLRGIVTDRDLVVRGLAEQPDPAKAKIGDLCSSDVVSVAPDDDVAEAIELMRIHAVRRLPVTSDDGELVGVLSLGDLAIERDERSALADISAEPPNK